MEGLNCPSRCDRLENIIRFWFLDLGGVVGDLFFGEGSNGFPAQSFDDRSWHAVQARGECFFVAAPAYCKICFCGPALLIGVWRGPFCDAGREAVGEEGGVAVYVGDYGVKACGVVGEDSGC